MPGLLTCMLIAGTVMFGDETAMMPLGGAYTFHKEESSELLEVFPTRDYVYVFELPEHLHKAGLPEVLNWCENEAYVIYE